MITQPTFKTKTLRIALIGFVFLAGFAISEVPASAQELPPILQPPVSVEESNSTEKTESAPTASMFPSGPISVGNLFEIITQGGWLMIPIVIASFILILFSLERLLSLRRGRVIPKPFVKRFLHQLKEGQLTQEEALELCETNKSPVADVFAHAVRKWGRSAVEVEQAIIDGGERSVNELRRYLRVINGVATVSPLLGLLGTVVGMIHAFNAISTSQAMGRPELLAGGISQALLTTAAGLTVAIPALIFYMYFVSKVDRLVIEIDAVGQEVVQQISAEALVAKPKSKTKPASSKAAATKKQAA